MRDGRKAPTSADAYIRVNGQRIATLEGVTETKNKNGRVHHSFGSPKPYAYSEGNHEYRLSIEYGYMDDGPAMTRYSLASLPDDAEIVVEKPGKRDIYMHCFFDSQSTRGTLGEKFMESVEALCLDWREELV